MFKFSLAALLLIATLAVYVSATADDSSAPEKRAAPFRFRFRQAKRGSDDAVVNLPLDGYYEDAVAVKRAWDPYSGASRFRFRQAKRAQGKCRRPVSRFSPDSHLYYAIPNR